MDDQVRKLKELGLSAECIHSGRDRESSRQACVDYIKGNLQFLFIAPERLRVPGFPEMLAKRKPSLVAIDEAHCISQWGHDFRPDYRMLGQYLPNFRPAPGAGAHRDGDAAGTERHRCTARADTGQALIHGFRRENIGIEVVEALRSQRPTLARAILLEAATARPLCIPPPASRPKAWQPLGQRIPCGRLSCRARCPTAPAGAGRVHVGQAGRHGRHHGIRHGHR